MSIEDIRGQILAVETECGAMSSLLQATFTNEMDKSFCVDLHDRIGDAEVDLSSIADDAEAMADTTPGAYTYDRLQEILGCLEAASDVLGSARDLAKQAIEKGMRQPIVDGLVSMLDSLCDTLTEASNA
jgi:hypothetical protein